MSFEDPVRRALDELDELHLFLHVIDPVIEGGRSAMFEASTKLRRALRKPVPTGEIYEKIHAQMMTLDDFMSSKGETYFLSLGVVKLCTIVEAMSDGFLVEFLSDRQRWKTLPLLRKMDVPLIEFTEADTDRQVELLAETVKEAVKSGVATGVGKFEAILNALGFGGPVPSLVQRTIFELIEVRNVIVHRAGRVDRRLGTLPEYAGCIGERLTITRQGFQRFIVSVTCYISEVLRRVSAVERKQEEEKDLREIIDSYLETLTKLSTVSVEQGTSQ